MASARLPIQIRDQFVGPRLLEPDLPRPVVVVPADDLHEVATVVVVDQDRTLLEVSRLDPLADGEVTTRLPLRPAQPHTGGVGQMGRQIGTQVAADDLRRRPPTQLFDQSAAVADGQIAPDDEQCPKGLNPSRDVYWLCLAFRQGRD